MWQHGVEGLSSIISNAVQLHGHAHQGSYTTACGAGDRISHGVSSKSGMPAAVRPVRKPQRPARQGVQPARAGQPPVMRPGAHGAAGSAPGRGRSAPAPPRAARARCPAHRPAARCPLLVHHAVLTLALGEATDCGTLPAACASCSAGSSSGQGHALQCTGVTRCLTTLLVQCEAAQRLGAPKLSMFGAQERTACVGMPCMLAHSCTHRLAAGGHLQARPSRDSLSVIRLCWLCAPQR